jgi:3-oxoacyl-[acyl-carrier-protein] synthase-3
VVDSGCGGSLYLLDMLVRMLSSGGARTAAVVGTNATSPFVNREVYSQRELVADDGSAMSPYLSMYVFGDGAGAIVIRRDRGSPLGIQGSLAGNDSQELVRCPGGGAVSPPYGERYKPLDHAFIVDGRLVASTYLHTMRRCIKTVADHAKCPLRDVERLYLHQPNERILGALAERLELRPEQVASNVARIGNTSSAGMFMLLAEDLESGRVALGSGAPVLFAAIGAGVHYAAQLALI